MESSSAPGPHPVTGLANKDGLDPTGALRHSGVARRGAVAEVGPPLRGTLRLSGAPSHSESPSTALRSGPASASFRWPREAPPWGAQPGGAVPELGSHVRVGCGRGGVCARVPREPRRRGQARGARCAGGARLAPGRSELHSLFLLVTWGGRGWARAKFYKHFVSPGVQVGRREAIGRGPEPPRRAEHRGPQHPACPGPGEAAPRRRRGGPAGK